MTTHFSTYENMKNLHKEKPLQQMCTLYSKKNHTSKSNG